VGYLADAVLYFRRVLLLDGIAKPQAAGGVVGLGRCVACDWRNAQGADLYGRDAVFNVGTVSHAMEIGAADGDWIYERDVGDGFAVARARIVCVVSDWVSLSDGSFPRARGGDGLQSSRDPGTAIRLATLRSSVARPDISTDPPARVFRDAHRVRDWPGDAIAAAQSAGAARIRGALGAVIRVRAADALPVFSMGRGDHVHRTGAGTRDDAITSADHRDFVHDDHANAPHGASGCGAESVSGIEGFRSRTGVGGSAGGDHSALWFIRFDQIN